MKFRLILIAIAVLILPQYVLAGDAGYLSVMQNDKTVLTLRISDRSLAFLAENPSQLTTILRERGIDCCLSHTRISEGVWRCCHGKFVITSPSRPIQDVMLVAFNEPQIGGR